MTPNLFLSTPSLATYLGKFMPAAQAAALAAGIGGLNGDAKLTGIPLATIAPGGTLAGSDILLSYQNVGDVRLWGADISGEFAATESLMLRGAFSWVNQNFFAASGPGDVDLSTNAPRAKAQGSARYAFHRDDASAELRIRYVDAFRMVDGVLIGDVPAYTVADLEVGMAVPSAPAAAPHADGAEPYRQATFGVLWTSATRPSVARATAIPLLATLFWLLATLFLS